MNQESTMSPVDSSPSDPCTLTVITAKEVAAILGMHVTSVYDGARAGQIPCRRVGRRFIFIRETILDWMARDATAA